VTLPGWLARLNRRVTNPALRPLAGRLPYFGVVLHRGRRTGRAYRTPVNAFPHGDGFLIALTYGCDVDWVKNVIAEGGCRLIHRGHGVDLIDPRVLPLPEDARSILGWIRGILRTLGVSEVLHLRPRDLPSGASAEENLGPSA
jgi:deazaflavin-dependent oxidoreductase (nitroreductase family)